MEKSNSITGRSNHLFPYLSSEITQATGNIDIIVSFLKESGLKMLLDQLVEAAQRGVKIRVLTGVYLNITEPSALYLLKSAFLAFPPSQFELRIYEGTDSFHPKSYLFTNEAGGTIYVGSSNLSHSALTSAVEWNYRFFRHEHPHDFAAFAQEFETLFQNALIASDELLRQYARQHRLPKLTPQIKLVDGHAKIVPSPPVAVAEDPTVYPLPQPHGAQIEALYELKKTRQEGFNKGLVVAATGIGKTYLAAFDSREFSRVLFLAHTEDILKQAAQTFASVLPHKSQGFFYGKQKDTAVDLLFATVQTLANQFETFDHDQFDYIVVDEFHHASAPTYQKIIQYFQPQFLLGLTATPERLDNRDVFALCDYNLVYEVRLAEAIERDWLVPFTYYGIYDPTDYAHVKRTQNRYQVDDLEQAFRKSKRAELIFAHYQRYPNRTTLGFCVSRTHALEMAAFFSQNGVKAYASFSGGSDSPYFLERDLALAKLRAKEIDVIFSVNMFNEGVDVPHIDLLLFLRPTESVTIFLQQLGRGLRKNADKAHVVVLDFIGNYRDVEFLPQVLAGNFQPTIQNVTKSLTEPKFPDGCTVHFDLQVVDLMKTMAQAKQSRDLRMNEALEQVFLEWEELGQATVFQHPSRLETYRYLADDITPEYLKMPISPLRNHLQFFHARAELAANEQSLLNTPAETFLAMVEKTLMTQLYKLPLLLAFIDGDTIRTTVDDKMIVQAFQQFYQIPAHQIDITRNKKTKPLATWTAADYLKIAKNPVAAFNKSGQGFFSGSIMSFSLHLDPTLLTPTFVAHLQDVIAFRREQFLKTRLERFRETLN